MFRFSLNSREIKPCKLALIMILKSVLYQTEEVILIEDFYLTEFKD